MEQMEDSEKPAPASPPKRSVGQKAQTAGRVAKVAAAIVTKNAGGAASAAGKGAAAAGVKGAAGAAAKGTAKSAATDVAAKTAKSTAGKGIGAAVPANPKEAAQSVVKKVSADGNDNTVKGTISNTLKGAASGAAGGAATGAIAGGVGAAPGAVIGAVKGGIFGLAANKKGRFLVLGVLFLLIGIPAVVTLFVGFSIGVSMAAGLGSTQTASAESLKASGYTDEEVREAIQLTGATRAPWQMTKAIERESGEPVDVDLLNEEMLKVDSSLKGFEMGTGAGYAPGENWRTIGKDDVSGALAQKVRENWMAVLSAYGKEHPLNEAKTYTLALAWYLGEKLEDCSFSLEGLETRDFKMADGTVRQLTDIQMNNAALIVANSRIEGVTEDAVIIALMAAITESNLLNYANETVPESLDYPHDAVGKDHDSVGLWQMRQHWGTTGELMRIPYQAKAFYGGPTGPNNGSPRGLLDIDGWDTMTKGEAAQAVEVSAYPDRYAGNEELATAILKNFTGGSVFGTCAGSIIFGDFAHPLGDPLKFGISSAYGPRTPIMTAGGWSSSYHRGTDFGAACNSPLYAVAAGTVTRTGWLGSWGNIVDLELDDGTKVKYAHQPYGTPWPAVGSRVQAGEQIGVVGTTGASSGCHLHIEVSIPDGPRVDPYDWFLERGIMVIFQNRFTEGYRPGAPTMW